MRNNINVKQVIVVRKDLKMRKGKIASQVAHASMKVFLDRGEIRYGMEGNRLIIPIDHPMQIWLTGLFTKIVVYVDSEKEFFDIWDELLKSDLPYAVIMDAGKTEFHGESTYTAIAIGPAESEKIDLITGNLPLL